MSRREEAAGVTPLGDFICLNYELAAAAGSDIDKALDRTHAASMAKVRADGKVRRRDGGKIIKPHGWTPPDLIDLVNENQPLR